MSLQTPVPSVTFNDQGAFGGDERFILNSVPALAGPSFQQVSANLIWNDDDVTEPEGGTSAVAIQSLLNPDANGSNTLGALLTVMATNPDNASTYGNLIGMYNIAYHLAAGALGGLRANYLDVENGGGAAVGFVTGWHLFLSNNGHIGTVRGVNVSAYDNSGGITDLFYGAQVEAPQGGTITEQAAYHNDNFALASGEGYSWQSQGGTLEASTGHAATVGMRIIAHGSQTADLTAWTDENEVVKARVDANYRGIFQTVQSSRVYTVATLPVAGGGLEGMRAAVSDLTTPVFLAAAVGGGAVHGPVYCNGSAWIVA